MKGPARSGKGPAKGPATLGQNVPVDPPFLRSKGGPALKGPAVRGRVRQSEAAEESPDAFIEAVLEAGGTVLWLKRE